MQKGSFSSNFQLINPFSKKRFKLSGFTLAEILLSLSIIGIVAAIALPSLLGNVTNVLLKAEIL